MGPERVIDKTMNDDLAAPLPPDSNGVRAWLEAVRRELHAIGERIEPLVAEQNRLRSREQLLTSLLRTLDPTQPPSGPSAPDNTGPSAAEMAAASGSVRDYVRRGVTAVLSDAVGPLHINELHARFIARGLRVPGAGRPANLTAHLSNWSGIVSPQRGFYALGSGANDDRVRPAAPTRRTSRRRRARKAK